jgi:hypothetical protein
LESFLSILLPNEGVHEAVTPLLLSHDTSLTKLLVSRDKKSCAYDRRAGVAEESVVAFPGWVGHG